MLGKRVLILVDNLRMGGIQRLALDQLFMLSDLEIPAEIHFRQLKATTDNPNFLSLETTRNAERKLSICSMPESRTFQFLYLIRLYRSRDFTDVINLSLGGTVLLQIAKIFSLRRPTIHTIVEQLPTLSAPTQRYKRFIYSCFSDRLYGYSQAVVWDWNFRLDHNPLSRFLFRKRPTVHRNGVYLERLPMRKIDHGVQSGPSRLVFVGRNVGWKNPELVLDLLRSDPDKTLSALIVVPIIDESYVDSLTSEFGTRVEFIVGKRVEDVAFRSGDIHVYPVDYGPSAKFTESVSINCLEMACLGIPSLVTQYGTDTWPELVELGLLVEVDWNNRESIQSSLRQAMKFQASEAIVSRAREVISIRRNVSELLSI